jgi:hypothetical protein
LATLFAFLLIVLNSFFSFFNSSAPLKSACLIDRKTVLLY